MSTKLLTEGKHRAHAIKGAFGETNKGVPQVGVQFALLDKPDGIKTATWYGTCGSKEAVAFTIKALRTAGFVGNDITDLSSLEREDTPEVLLVVEHETYKGVAYTKVKYVNSAGGVGMKNALTGRAAADFAAKMRGAFAAYDQEHGGEKARPAPVGKARAAAPPPDDPPPLGDDDAPPADWENEADLPF